MWGVVTSQIAQAIGAVIVYHYPADGEVWDIGVVVCAITLLVRSIVIARHYLAGKEPSGIEVVAVRHYPADRESSDIGAVIVRHYPAGRGHGVRSERPGRRSRRRKSIAI